MKTGDIYLIDDAGRRSAYLRPADGSADVFLAAADLKACDTHPYLRELLFELAGEIALNRERASGAHVVLREREPLSQPVAQSSDVVLPCETCTAPQAEDVRGWLRSCSAEDVSRQLSPGGWPPGCCHVRAVGQFGSQALRTGR
jgi:hypothetical protein